MKQLIRFGTENTWIFLDRTASYETRAYVLLILLHIVLIYTLVFDETLIIFITTVRYVDDLREEQAALCVAIAIYYQRLFDN